MKIQTTLVICALFGALHCPAQRAIVQPWHFGAIDVGSKGIKSTLFRFVRDGEWKDTQVIAGGTRNSCLVGKMTPDKKFTPDCIQEATAHVTALLKDMEAAATARRISNVRYFVVGSSGVAQGKNKDELVAAVKTATGLDLEFIDAPTEARYGLISAVPPRFRGTAVMIDQGSGNTKIACQDKGPTDVKTAEIVLGTVSTSNEAFGLGPLSREAKDFADFAKKLQKQTDVPKRIEALDSVANAATELMTLANNYNDQTKRIRAKDLVQSADDLYALVSGTANLPELLPRAKKLTNFASNVQKAELDYNFYVEQVDRVVLDEVKPVYVREARNKPCLAPNSGVEPGRIYPLGGGPWAAATMSYPELSYSAYVPITTGDVQGLLKQLKEGKIPAASKPTSAAQWARARAIEDAKKRAVELGRLAALDKKAASEREQVLKVFSRDHQLSGLALLNSVLEAVERAGALNTKVLFVRNSSYIYGYALDKYKEARDSD